MGGKPSSPIAAVCNADEQSVCRWQTTVFMLVSSFAADDAHAVVRLSHICSLWRAALVASEGPTGRELWVNIIDKSRPEIVWRLQSGACRTPPAPRSPSTPSITAAAASSSQLRYHHHHNQQSERAEPTIDHVDSFSGPPGGDDSFRRQSTVSPTAAAAATRLGSSHSFHQLLTAEGNNRVPAPAPLPFAGAATNGKVLSGNPAAASDTERSPLIPLYAVLTSSSSPNRPRRDSLTGEIHTANTSLTSPPGAAAAAAEAAAAAAGEGEEGTETVSSGVHVGEEFVALAKSASCVLWALEHLAFKAKYSSMNKQLLNYKSVRTGNAAFIAAVQSGNLRVLPTLLRANCGINRHGAHGTTALLEAIKRSDVALVKFLLQNGASILSQDAVGNSTLTEAVRADPSGEMLRLVLASEMCTVEFLRSPATQRNNAPQQHPPLSPTTPPQSKSVAAQMLESHFAKSGIDAAVSSSVTIADKALVMAVNQGFVDCAKILLRDGAADVNCVDPATGLTPLHIAVKSSFATTDLFDLLLESGANIDAMTQTHHTPLMQAAIVNDAVLAEKLIKAGAKKSVREVSGCSALGLAERHRNHEVAEMLRRLGCE